MKHFLMDLRRYLRRTREFVTHDVWNIGEPDSYVPHSVMARQIRVFVVMLQGLGRDMLFLRAAALSFATIFGIVPFLAIVFFVIDTFNVNDEVYGRLYNALRHIVAQQDEERPDVGGFEQKNHPLGPETTLTEQLKDFLFQGVAQEGELGEEELQDPVEVIMNSVQRADPKSLGLAGIVFVLTTVFGLMQNIEGSFNTIWGIRRTRSWYRMFSDYLMFLIFLPFFAAVVLSIPALLESDLREQMSFPTAWLLQLAKYTLIWVAFAAMYVVVPNTRVHLRYATVAGVVAGTLWALLSAAYVSFQFGLGRYGLIYATFAQIPIFLMWVFLSWLILLMGAELAFAYQNEKTFAMERYAKGASHAYREALALRAMIAIAQRFDKGQPPLKSENAAKEWNVPSRLINDTLDLLEKANLVRASGRDDIHYQPARSLDRITVGDVINAIHVAGRDPSALLRDPTLGPLFEKVAERSSPADQVTLGEVVRGQENAEAQVQPQEPDAPEPN
jgi:membrane protein